MPQRTKWHIWDRIEIDTTKYREAGLPDRSWWTDLTLRWCLSDFGAPIPRDATLQALELHIGRATERIKALEEPRADPTEKPVAAPGASEAAYAEYLSSLGSCQVAYEVSAGIKEPITPWFLTGMAREMYFFDFGHGYCTGVNLQRGWIGKWFDCERGEILFEGSSIYRVWDEYYAEMKKLEQDFEELRIFKVAA